MRAVSDVGKILGIKTVGFVRGNEFSTLNKNLLYCKKNNMDLRFISRESYKEKNKKGFLNQLRKEFPNCYIIPEGSDNKRAELGVKEIVDELTDNYDYIVCSCGTGNTLKGILSNTKKKFTGLGFTSFKQVQDFEKKLDYYKDKFKLINSYRFGGFGKKNNELINFIKYFNKENNILLDYVYNGKTVYGVFDMIKNNMFKKNDKILVVITGGVPNANVYEI